MTQSEDFAALANQAGEDLPSIGDLPEVLREAREALGRVDNVGRSADEHNAYVLVDRVVATLRLAFPESLCAPGCGRCCRMHRALIRVYRSEWEPVFDHLLTWPGERLDRLIEAFYRSYDAYLPDLHAIQRSLDTEERPRVAEADLPVSCPLLVDGSCSVYPVRPAICRGYGHFELTNATGDRTEIFACPPQRDVLEAQLEPVPGLKLKLPSFNPFYQAVSDVCDGEEKLLIPLWFERSFPRPR